MSISARRGVHRDQGQAIQLWHEQIAQDQVKRPLRWLGQRQAPIGGRRHCMAATRQDMTQGAGDVGFIIDDRNRSGTCGARRQDLVLRGIWKGNAPDTTGNATEKTVPCSGWLWTLGVPPCSSTMPRQRGPQASAYAVRQRRPGGMGMSIAFLCCE
jgi:hypothetical protein